MSLSIVCDEPIFVECSRIDVCGDHCEECDGMGEYGVDISWLATLAHNLAIGAALCRAHENGFGCDWSCSEPCTKCWAPGCGWSAP